MSKKHPPEQNNVVALPQTDEIKKQAAGWLAVLDCETAGDRDRAAFRQWLQTSDRHRAAFSELNGVWLEMAALTELRDIGEAAPTQRRFSRRAGIPAAAAVVAFAGGGAFVSHYRPLDQSGSFDTAVGEQRTVKLPDGSILHLNTDSRAEVAYARSERRVRLVRGEAHFDVKPDVRRPFSVYAAGGVIEAIGTAFAVRLQSGDAIEVTVEEGRVALAALPTPAANAEPGKKVAPLAELNAGQRAVFGSKVEEVRDVADTELKRRLSWRRGVLAYAGEPLADVIADISRYTDISIEIADPALGAVPVAGYFHVGETEALFEALELSFGIRVERVSEGRVLLSDGA